MVQQARLANFIFLELPYRALLTEANVIYESISTLAACCGFSTLHTSLNLTSHTLISMHVFVGLTFGADSILNNKLFRTSDTHGGGFTAKAVLYLALDTLKIGR
jgi:hypothetical protein